MMGATQLMTTMTFLDGEGSLMQLCMVWDASSALAVALRGSAGSWMREVRS